MTLQLFREHLYEWWLGGQIVHTNPGDRAELDDLDVELGFKNSKNQIFQQIWA